MSMGTGGMTAERDLPGEHLLLAVVTEKILSYTNCWSDSVNHCNLIFLWHLLTWKCSSSFQISLSDIFLFPLDSLADFQKQLYIFLRKALQVFAGP